MFPILPDVPRFHAGFEMARKLLAKSSSDREGRRRTSKLRMRTSAPFDSNVELRSNGGTQGSLSIT